MASLFLVNNRLLTFIVPRLPGAGGGQLHMVGCLITNVTSLDAEVLPVQLDFSQIDLVKKLGGHITAVNNVRVFDGSGNLSTDFTVGAASIVASSTFGTANAAVDFTLTNVNAGLAGGTPVPTNYLVTCQVTFSNGAELLAGLDVEVQAPPGTNRVPCF